MNTIQILPADDLAWGEAANGSTAVEPATEVDADVVVIDVSLSGSGGAGVTARLRAARPGQKVLLLIAHKDRGHTRLLLDAGAAGCAPERAPVAEPVLAIRAAGGADPDAGPVAPDAELSEREAEVVRLIALGYSNKEIAARLKLSVKTIETYKTRSMEKLRIRTRVDLVRYAVGRGWLNNP